MKQFSFKERKTNTRHVIAFKMISMVPLTFKNCYKNIISYISNATVQKAATVIVS